MINNTEETSARLIKKKKRLRCLKPKNERGCYNQCHRDKKDYRQIL
jgi:hypothetical protein